MPHREPKKPAAANPNLVGWRSTARVGAIAFALLAAQGCGGPAVDSTAYARARALVPLHAPLGDPRPGDWLDRHEEAGQTFEEYVASDPVTALGARRTVHVVTVGAFSEAQRRVLDETLVWIEAWFGLPVTRGPEVPSDAIPEAARRRSPHGAWTQILTRHVLEDVLRPNLPDDAACSIAFCADDLWPGDGWNFVFGQASLRHRVGVWSIHRNGDPAASDAAYRLCLLRTIKTATHEIGHMFGMAHCTLFECNMCGSNHREESDRRPLRLCPECLPKVVHATGVAPQARFERLAALARAAGLEEERRYFFAAGALWGPGEESDGAPR